VLASYVSGHGFGHATRLLEVLREVRARAPALRLALAGTIPPWLVRETLPGEVLLRPVECDPGLVQRDALVIDEPASAAAVAAFDADLDARAEREAAFLRAAGARLVLADVPPLAFEAARRAGVPALALGNFSWDWIWRHLAEREPALAPAADRAARAYGGAEAILALPFAGDLSAFRRRVEVGLVARVPHVPRDEVRRRLGLDGRPAVLVSFGGVGLPGLARAALERDRGLQFVLPEDADVDRLRALGLRYPDLVAACDVVLTKPGYGIVSDAIAAGTRLVYTERGDFPEYPVMVREMSRWLAAVHLGNGEVRAGRVGDAVRAALALPVPAPPPLDGAARAAAEVLAALGAPEVR
jgi:L-arabinokinase